MPVFESWGAARFRAAVAVLTAACFASMLSAAAGQGRARKGGNPAAAKVKNPVAATPESIAAGRRVYRKMCEKCHGPEGKGDGTAATGDSVPADLTDAQWDFGSSDGEIFSAVHDGTSDDMDGYAQRLSDADIWNVVNYVRTLGPKP